MQKKQSAFSYTFQWENPKEMACTATRNSAFIYSSILSYFLTSRESVNDIKIQFEFLSMHYLKTTRFSTNSKGGYRNWDEILLCSSLGRMASVRLVRNYSFLFFKAARCFRYPLHFFLFLNSRKGNKKRRKTEDWGGEITTCESCWWLSETRETELGVSKEKKKTLQLLIELWIQGYLITLFVCKSEIIKTQNYVDQIPLSGWTSHLFAI